jgi:VanZ family protein
VKRLVIWLPPILWVAVVLAMSSPTMSSEQTGGILRPVLAWLLPWLRPVHADLIHYLVRKSAHVVEYGVLALLWRRAFLLDASLAPSRGGWAALGISLVVAIIDERHQAFIPSRTGTSSDIVLDTVSAAAAIVCTHVGWWRVVETVTGVLLWVGAVGGLGALVLNLAAGVGGGVLWLSVPAAGALLLYRRRRSAPRT